jgi:hypothetical protein
MVDLGILYYFIFGVAGAGGSLAAGLFLDTLTGFGVPVFSAYKALFVV